MFLRTLKARNSRSLDKLKIILQAFHETSFPCRKSGMTQCVQFFMIETVLTSIENTKQLVSAKCISILVISLFLSSLDTHRYIQSIPSVIIFFRAPYSLNIYQYLLKYRLNDLKLYHIKFCLCTKGWCRMNVFLHLISCIAGQGSVSINWNCVLCEYTMANGNKM